MGLSDRTTAGVEACYDALLDAERWPSAMQHLAESLGAESCTFATAHGPEGAFRIPRSTGHEDFAQLWLANQAHAPDPHAALGRRRNHASGFLLEEDVTTEEQRRSLPYFNETARPGNREWWALAKFSVEGRGWCFALYRSRPRGPFTVGEARYFVQLASPLARLVGLAEKLARKETSRGIELLQHLGTAAIVLDAGGVARQINTLAEAILGQDFHLARGRPVASDSASNRSLQAMLAAGRGPRPRAVVIHRDGAPWLLAEVLPVTALGRDVFSTDGALLLLTDLTSRERRRPWAFGAAFGLTPAEARLACLIASGIGIDEAAASLGIARETVRTQLKAVFAKTGTRSQAALAALAGRMRS